LGRNIYFKSTNQSNANAWQSIQPPSLGDHLNAIHNTNAVYNATSPIHHPHKGIGG
jgi:hypothetical protein